MLPHPKVPSQRTWGEKLGKAMPTRFLQAGPTGHGECSLGVPIMSGKGRNVS